MPAEWKVEISSSFGVEWVTGFGSDQLVCQAARVSTLGADSLDTKESAGLINFLLKNRHGSPFEHGAMTFRIIAPIFVWREFMRHRIGFSYNEQSARYMEMLPLFYLPHSDRPLEQVGKVSQYTFASGPNEQRTQLEYSFLRVYEDVWDQYKYMLNIGIAKEVARIVLPVGIYSTAYVTCNPRSLMSFLSLRTHSESSTFPSFPQWEIEQVAKKMEAIFAGLFPLSHEAFVTNGRVSP